MPSEGGGIKLALTPAAPPTQSVLVTGSGTTPDEANKHALSAAMERVVGVLVDAIAFKHALYTCTTRPQRFSGRDLRYSINWDSTTPLVPKSEGQARVYLCRDSLQIVEDQ